MIKSNRAVTFLYGRFLSISPISCFGSDRFMSHATSKERDSQKSTHWFRNLFPWKKPEDVCETLQKNVIYEDDNIIAFNKPFELPMHSLKYNEHSAIADPRLGDVSVQAALPLLKKVYNLEQPLVPIFSQHRTCSGVMVMAKTRKAVEFYSKNFNIERTNKKKHQKYCALTLGIPEERTDLTVYMTKNPPTHPLKANFSLTRPTKRRRQGAAAHGKITTAMLDCHVLAESRAISQVHVAAVELDTSASNWELLAAFCVESLCPILGEYNHAARIKTVLGRPILTKGFDQNKPVPPLHALLCHHLGITENESLYTPAHLHCFQLALGDMGKPKRGQILLQAPLPDYFTKTLQRLELHIPPEHVLANIPDNGRGIRTQKTQVERAPVAARTEQIGEGSQGGLDSEMDFLLDDDLSDVPRKGSSREAEIHVDLTLK